MFTGILMLCGEGVEKAKFVKKFVLVQWRLHFMER